MRWSAKDRELFLKLYFAVLAEAAKKYQLCESPMHPSEVMELSTDDKLNLRDLVADDPEVIEALLKANPYDFNERELAILKDWQDAVFGQFFVLKHRRNYSVLLSSENSSRPYAVHYLTGSLKELFPNGPDMIETLLLPFKGVIVSDGLFLHFSINCTSALKVALKNGLKKARNEFGIIDHLSESA